WEVRKVANGALSACVRAGDDLAGIAKAIGDGSLPTALATAVFRHIALFSTSDLDAMWPALESPDDKRRLAALDLLRSPALAPVRVRATLERLRWDPNNNIREEAAT